MRRYSVMYFISQSFKGLWRNGVMTLASITVLMSCLVVMGSFALIVANLNENLESLGDMNEIVAFVDFEKELCLLGIIYHHSRPACFSCIVIEITACVDLFKFLCNRASFYHLFNARTIDIMLNIYSVLIGILINNIKPLTDSWK